MGFRFWDLSYGLRVRDFNNGLQDSKIVCSRFGHIKGAGLGIQADDSESVGSGFGTEVVGSGFGLKL